METKVCKVCGQELPLSEFKKSPFATNGIATCKKCVSEKIKKTKLFNNFNYYSSALFYSSNSYINSYSKSY